MSRSCCDTFLTFPQGQVTDTLVSVQPGFKKQLTESVLILKKEIVGQVQEYDKVNYCKLVIKYLF